MPPTVTITPWPDPVIDTLGFDPRASYVETFWLPTLGPTSDEQEPEEMDQMTKDELRDLACGILTTRGVVPELADAVRAFDGDPFLELFACVVAMESEPALDVGDAAYVAAARILATETA